MLNNVALMGRLTDDPVLRQTQENVSVTTFTLAVNRDGKSDEADFIDIVCWRGTAEFASKHFVKGSKITLSGRLQTRTWQDKYGNNRKTVEVIAEEVFFC